MTGRGMRHKDDWNLSIILDRQFIKLYYDNQKLFPKWWREAVVFDENDPKWRDVIKNLGKD
jgi:Rad3-related DNA helicase